MTAAGLLGLAMLAGCSSSSSSTSSGSGPSSTSASTAAQKKLVVGVSLAGYSTDFWAAYVQYEATYAKQLGLTLDGPISANGDAATQASQIQTMINQHVSALLVNPVDSAAISTTDALAAKANIPVVMMDVGPTTGHIYAVVRANNLLIGQEACQYIGKRANGTGTAAVLEGDLASINGLDRANGFVNCMKQDFPKMKVLTYATKWDSTAAVDDAQTAVRAYSGLKGIYCSFSGPDQGILAAIHSAGAQDRVVLVETDGVPAELGLIRSGQLAAAVSQPVNGYALWGLTYAKDAIEGVAAPAVGTATSHGSSIVNLSGSPEDALPSTFVTKANVGETALWGNSYKTS
ncbi:MAG: sugar ABC transporter substrate-binding protein [Actinomycetota bacterium]|nr:sugar ABC transporter substrate-binding protein [Actinomycetota bacterium]